MQYRYRSNLDKHIAVTVALRANPRRSNVAIARDTGTTELLVRRCRRILEASSIISTEPVREGLDGKVYTVPNTAGVSV